MNLKNMVDGKIWVIRATGIESMMSGAYKCAFDSTGLLRLMYNDNFVESVTMPLGDAQKLVDEENWFSIVDAVQSKREDKQNDK